MSGIDQVNADAELHQRGSRLKAEQRTRCTARPVCCCAFRRSRLSPLYIVRFMERGEVQRGFTRRRTLNRRKRSTFNRKLQMGTRQWGRFMERDEVQRGFTRRRTMNRGKLRTSTHRTSNIEHRQRRLSSASTRMASIWSRSLNSAMQSPKVSRSVSNRTSIALCCFALASSTRRRKNRESCR